MKKNFVKGMVVVALLGATAASFVSCKDNDSDIKTELQGQFQEQFVGLSDLLEKYRAELQAQINGLQEQIDKIKQCGCGEEDSDLQKLIAYVEANKARIASIDQLASDLALIKGNYASKDYVSSEIASQIASALSGYAEESAIKAWVEQYVAAELAKLSIPEGGLSKEEVESIVRTIVASYGYVTESELDSKLATELGKLNILSEGDVNTLIQNFMDNYDFKSKVDAIIAEYGYLNKEGLAEALKEYDFVTKDYFKSEEFTNVINDILDSKGYVTDEVLTEKLNTLGDAMEKLLEEQVYELEQKIEAVKDLISELLNKMITSIEVNATDNPVFGGAAFPVDIRTTVLAAYYGEAAANFLFPDNNLMKELANAGISVERVGADAGDKLLNGEGNAGTLYLTINPSNVDFTGDNKIQLLNSRGEEAPVKLGEVKKSDKLLSFGYSRGVQPNFYEVSATLAEEDIDAAKVNINFNGMKDAVKDVLNQRSKASVAKLAANLFSEASDILPAYAAVATWTDNISGEEHGVFSQYSLAATAVKPLSYEFMKDAKYNIPFLERFENLVGDGIDNLFKQITDIIPDFSEVGDITIGKIELSEATKESLKMRVEITIAKGELTGELNRKEIEVKDKDGKVIGTAEVSDVRFENEKAIIEYELDLTERFQNIIDDINDSLNFDELQDALNSLAELSEINSNVTDLRDNIKNKIFSYIDRLNTRFSNLVGSINTALQPCLLYEDSKGNLGRVTASATGTQVTGSSIVLHPTSYTAELFAPAFKKFVAVTAIDGATDGVAAFNAANENLGVVLTGDVDEIEVKGLEKGKKYEITYSAVDFSGITRTKKCYIAVK